MADPSINAFALPGGYVGVNTGLHSARSDRSPSSRRCWRTKFRTSRSTTSRARHREPEGCHAGFARGARRGSRRSAVARRIQQRTDRARRRLPRRRGIAIQMQINFTRQNEQEADRIGFQRLDAAGFDVTGDGDVDGTACSARRDFVEGNAPSYLRDHPVTYERIAEAQARAQANRFGRSRIRWTSTWCARSSRATRDAAGSDRCSSRMPSPRKNTTTRVAARYGLVASLLRARGFQACAERAGHARTKRASASHDRRHGGQVLYAVRDSFPRPSRATRRRWRATRPRCN